MNILILTALYPPAVGGAASYFGSIVPRLVQRDEIEELIVLTERMPGLPRESRQNKLWLLRCLPTRGSVPRRTWLMHALTYVMTQLWFMAFLPGLVKRRKVDLIHFHTRFRGRLFYAALRRAGVPVVADLRDKMTDPEHLIGIVDYLLCCGEGVQRFAVEGGFPIEQTAMIPNAFEPPDIPLPSLVSDIRQRYRVRQGPYLLFVGDITYNKGVYDLLQAYQRWRLEHAQVQLVFAGVNREGNHFCAQVESMTGAMYLGHVPHRDALALMRGAEIVVLPSRSEGLPTVVLEAVALGTKVICPPGIPEFERYLAQYVLPEVSADAIVRTLDAVWHCDDLPLYPLSEHSVPNVVEALVKVYGERM